MPWNYRILILLPLLIFHTAYADWGEGYDPIDPPIATTAPDGKIEVIEFFWYGCPHCYQMEPQLEAWLESKPENVSFIRVPAPLNNKWTVHAQFFYAAEILGLTEKLHIPLFEALHDKKRRLYDKDSLIGFAVEQGVDKQKFIDALNSFGVYVKVQNAKKLGQRYQLDGVPAIGINGKYKTSGSLAGSYSKMFEIVSQLVAEESKATP
ncbi:MAG: thiol:disulfide interchange protein DsbA/DsbL [Candidatus Thiodiazotropha sp. (ex Lucina aurantia)]|uniref:Thiol:disulfide interchange protein n=1 Tax=Candidatus Thiodiazotropha endolucinida TaxID=1655433 RepID=A0A7Z0VPN4_9GAMM|nr:thiol:disulfide interchange protein DsbA/DsbL [Candidatus Thiodiazotropha endolucinida]MBT3012177.1 thiol:disulfide interchange protein DsbA/DsbL [Candidatus Thiodiazotropha sp. (ex Lucina pensylvanica)]MBT3016132.1 thiol:disulfide interchange protein DsbA/DsbL [Candidatus Thiodiazotropha taylori]MBT3038732.1 thiol:disulfide interchange protein DsbA/DsbL [Candidatus Thiodiazotropha sp. (ex Codakia orbicularis)]MBV2102706.1 thiol:disulfide interchange protein DsbA/DsbL [Candidatus Thiodiazotr